MNLGYLIRGLPGHPIHPPLTDATIGAYTFALVAAILSKIGVADHAAAQAWWLALVVALAASVLTVLAGFVDWFSITRGTPLFRTATTHMIVMATASVLFLLAAVFGHSCYVDGSISTGPFVLTIVGYVTMAIGGWLGGAITYVYGMRVLSLVDEPALKAASPVPTPEKRNAEGG
jgi:uncharacterized membrane protein